MLGCHNNNISSIRIYVILVFFFPSYYVYGFVTRTAK